MVTVKSWPFGIQAAWPLLITFHDNNQALIETVAIATVIGQYFRHPSRHLEFFETFIISEYPLF